MLAGLSKLALKFKAFTFVISFTHTSLWSSREGFIMPSLGMRKLELGWLSGFSKPGSSKARTGTQVSCLVVLPGPLVSALSPAKLMQELSCAVSWLVPSSRGRFRQEMFDSSWSWSLFQPQSSSPAHTCPLQPCMRCGWQLPECFKGCRVLCSISFLTDQLSTAV